MNSELEHNNITKSELSSWMEYDYNPFIIYNRNGEIVYLNRAAELLLGYENQKTFYNISLSYAPIDFGYKTTFINLNYDKFNFFGITVGYENEDKIGIRLYQNPKFKETSLEKIKSYETTNIYVLIEISTTLAKSTSQAKFLSEFDPTLPEFKISQNDFSKVLRKIYQSFSESKIISTILKLKTGEALYVVDKKYKIVELVVKGDIRDQKLDEDISKIASSINVHSNFDQLRISLDIPMIL